MQKLHHMDILTFVEQWRRNYVPRRAECLAFEKYANKIDFFFVSEFCNNTLVYSTADNIKILNLTSNETRIVKSAVQTKLLAAAQDVIYYTTYHDESKTIFKITSGNNSEWLKSS